MGKPIWILYSCDEWKSYDGMRVVCASTSSEKIKKAIIAEINDEHMDYCDAEWSRSEMVKEFKSDWGSKIRDYINNNILFGFYDYITDGERQ